MKKSTVSLSKNSPLVSVIILNYNGREYLGSILKECLDSVFRTNYPNYEVIFVDNGSIDDSVDYVRKDFGSKIMVIRNEINLGFAKGFNVGMRASKGRYLALLSNDMVVDPNWLNPIVDLMESDQKIGLAGFKRMQYGKKDFLDGIGGLISISGRVTPIGAFEIDRGQYDTVREDLDFIGGAMVIRRKSLQKIGLFDTDYVVYTEDVDLCCRLQKQGYKTVYVPRAVLWHVWGATFEGIDPSLHYTYYMANRTRIRFGIIHFALRRVFAMFMVDSLFILLSNVYWKKLLLKAYWWNLKNSSSALKKRFLYGSSLSRCKYPVTHLKFSRLLKLLRTIFRL